MTETPSTQHDIMRRSQALRQLRLRVECEITRTVKGNLTCLIDDERLTVFATKSSLYRWSINSKKYGRVIYGETEWADEGAALEDLVRYAVYRLGYTYSANF